MDLRSFGRRRGRKISARQQRLLDDVLPRMRIDLTAPAPEPLTDLFPTPCHPGRSDHGTAGSAQSRDPGEAGGASAAGSQLASGGRDDKPGTRETWLEIGFGGAEHLIWQAAHHPHVGIIGCEPFEEGVVKALTAIEEKGLGNVRIHPDDARDVLRWLPPASIARAFILFPDPWPKRKHVKRRLVGRPTLDMLARVLTPGAELRLATDIGDYVRTMLIAAADHPAFDWQAAGPSDWRVRPADWPQTRYEQKAIREGRRGYFFRFLRV